MRHVKEPKKNAHFENTLKSIFCLHLLRQKTIDKNAILTYFTPIVSVLRKK